MSESKEFVENPIVPTHGVLKGLHEKIIAKGFNFSPGDVFTAIDKEAKKQFADICHEFLNGVPLKSLIAVRDEVHEWMLSEDARYEEWKKSQVVLATPPEEILATPPVEKVTPIHHKKKK